MATRSGQRDRGGSPAGLISSGVVQLFRRYTGRGPTRAHTMVNDDTVTVVMRETLTDAERTMIGAGYEQDVLRARRAYQTAMREELTSSSRTARAQSRQPQKKPKQSARTLAAPRSAR